MFGQNRPDRRERRFRLDGWPAFRSCLLCGDAAGELQAKCTPVAGVGFKRQAIGNGGRPDSHDAGRAAALRHDLPTRVTRMLHQGGQSAALDCALAVRQNVGLKAMLTDDRNGGMAAKGKKK